MKKNVPEFFNPESDQWNFYKGNIYEHFWTKIYNVKERRKNV